MELIQPHSLIEKMLVLAANRTFLSAFLRSEECGVEYWRLIIELGLTVFFHVRKFKSIPGREPGILNESDLMSSSRALGRLYLRVS